MAHELKTLGFELRVSKDPYGGLESFATNPLCPDKIIGTYYGPYITTTSLLVLNQTASLR